MFRYEKQAFLRSADNLRDVCRDLRECEEALRMLDLAWKRNPDMPAPRQRLTRSLQTLEQRETSLTLLERKMTSVSRIYEAAEQRVESLAEETAADKSAMAAEEKTGDQSERVKKTLDSVFFTPEVCAAGRPKPPGIASEKTPPRISPRGAALPSGISERVNKMANGYIGWEGHVIPLRPLRPFRPFPWAIRPYRPFLIFPPRRPRAIKRWILMHLFRKLFPNDRWLAPLYRRYPVQHHTDLISPLTPLYMQAEKLLFPERQQRRARLDRLFRA